MDLANCSICGKLIVKPKRDFCDGCSIKLVKVYNEIRAYLSENPHASIMEVQKETGISLKTIKSMIQ